MDSQVKVYQQCPDLETRLVAKEKHRGKAQAVLIPVDCPYSPLCYPCLTRRRNRERQIGNKN